MRILCEEFANQLQGVLRNTSRCQFQFESHTAWITRDMQRALANQQLDEWWRAPRYMTREVTEKSSSYIPVP